MRRLTPDVLHNGSLTVDPVSLKHSYVVKLYPNEPRPIYTLGDFSIEFRNSEISYSVMHPHMLCRIINGNTLKSLLDKRCLFIGTMGRNLYCNDNVFYKAEAVRKAIEVNTILPTISICGRPMDFLGQRYVMGVFFPHVLFPYNQVISKIRRFLFLLSIAFVFAGQLAFTYTFYSPCNASQYESVTGGGTDLDGYVFLAYIILSGWGLEFYWNAVDETAWIFVWQRLASRPHTAGEILAYIKASVFGGDPELGLWNIVKNFPGLTWQDRLLEILRPLGAMFVFIGLVLLPLARNSDIVDGRFVCNFYLSYWGVACLFFSFAFVPVFCGAFLQFFVLVPPLSPFAAAVSLHDVFQFFGPEGSLVTDYKYLDRVGHCQCRWQLITRTSRSRGFMYPVFEREHPNQACSCNLPSFGPGDSPPIEYTNCGPHWLYMLLAAAFAAMIIGAYRVCKQQVGNYYLYGAAGQVWAIIAIFAVNLIINIIIKDIARDRFMCWWTHDGLTAGYITVSTRIWGSGAEWVWTALLYKQHRRFGKWALMAYMAVFWVMLASIWMSFDGLFPESSDAFDVVYGSLFIGFVLSSGGFYYLKRDFNHPTISLKPQPLKVMRWIYECIDVEERDVPRTKLGTVGQRKRVTAGVSTAPLPVQNEPPNKNRPVWPKAEHGHERFEHYLRVELTI